MGLNSNGKFGDSSQKKSLFPETIKLARPLAEGTGNSITDKLLGGNKNSIKEALEAISSDRKVHYSSILLELLAKTPDLRKNIIDTLADLGIANVIEHILQYANDPNTEIRIAVCRAAGKLPFSDSKSIATLNQKLSDSDENVKYAALNALVLLGHKYHDDSKKEQFRQVLDSLLIALKYDVVPKADFHQLLILDDGSLKGDLEKMIIEKKKSEEDTSKIEKLLSCLK